MSIDDYILYSRKSYGKPFINILEIYKETFKKLKEYLPFDIGKIELAIAYSTNKTSEILTDFNGRTYLIYDQYLGQSFNMLNRIYFNSKQPEVGQYYAFKLLAEELQLLGNPKIALVCALVYIKEIEKYNSYKKDENFSKRIKYTFIQEVFVIVHELVHIWLKESNDKESFEITRKGTIDLLNNKYRDFHYDNTSTYLSDRHFALYGQNGSFKDYLSNDDVADLNINFKNAQIKFINKSINFVANNNELIEELICDEIATTLLLPFLYKEYRYSYEESLDAIYIGLMSLRLFGIVNKQALDIVRDEPDYDAFLTMSQVRLISYRNKSLEIYRLFNKSEEEINLLNNTITLTNQRYSSYISDRVLFNNEEKISVLKSEFKNHEVEFDYDGYIKYNNLVDTTLKSNFFNK